MSFICSVCGKPHDGFPAIVYHSPALHDRASEEERKQDFQITDDLCRYKFEHFFVRCVLLIPVVDVDVPPLEFGVWSTLSQENFRRYVETFEDPKQSKLGPMFGWLSNEIAGYPDTLNLACQVLPQDNRQRPRLELEQTDHPLAIQQRDGVTLDYVTKFMHERGFA